MVMIEATVFTLKDISQISIAESFLKKLELLGIQPEFVSLNEPIKETYTKEKAIEYWIKEEDGCWDEESEKYIGKAGGVLAKNKKNLITYMISWWKCNNFKKVNMISFYISISKYKKKQEEILCLFKETVNIIDAFYGYIAHSDTVERQHATGTIINRIPGMFWCNYFSSKYINFFGKEKFTKSEWHKIENNQENGIFVFLDDKPHGRLLQDKEIEENAKKFLGYDSFANKQEEDIMKKDIVKWQNGNPIQYKNVPKLF